MPGQPVTQEKKREKRERERERQNSISVIAQTWWNKLLHKFLSWTLNRYFLRMSYIKWMHIFCKNCLIVFFFVQE